jgi:Tfp pilus assembly protein PilO
MQNDLNNTNKNKYSPFFPYLKQEKSQKFFGVVLTLCVLSFFGFFAIKPTVSTILKLRKEIEDNKFVLSQLENKIRNLSGLRKQYSILQEDLPIITSAITMQPDAQILLAQIQAIAQNSNISIKSLQNSEVEIERNDATPEKDYYPYAFSISGAGSFENISKFMKTLTNMERIVNIDNISINNTSNQNSNSSEFNIQGTTFFKKIYDY